MYKNHKIDHLVRTTVLTYKICQSLNVNEYDTMVLLISALLHDIGRKNNSNDIRHGEIGACKAKQLLKDKKIFDIIKNHSIGDRNIKSEHKEMILILKDADALERIRNNDLNVKYIRNKESLCLIDFAKSLFSELRG